MKFLTLGSHRLGVVVGESVVDIPEACSSLGERSLPETLRELIEVGEAAVQAAWETARRAVEARVAVRPLASVRPRAPIPEPRRNILCIGKNYRAHVSEVAATALGGSGIPERPIFFTKATTAVIGPGDWIPSHRELTGRLDYEAEVAVIIGRGGRDIPSAEAMEHVFGYTAINDVSARDLQAGHVQWFRGKSLDGFAPMGPLVVHRSAMRPVEEIKVSCRVNGELRQEGNLGQLIFDIPTIIATLSAGMTLLPGDIIATGTPKGVGAGFDPPRFLVPGDRVEVEVTDVGVLTNLVE